MAGPHPRVKEPLNPWGAIAHEYPEAGGGGAEPSSRPANSDRVGLAEGLKRLSVILAISPVATLMNLAGLVYAGVCIYYFARGNWLETYGVASEEELRIDPSTPVINSIGALLLVVWATLPPLWFFAQYYVFAKTPDQKQAAEAGQSLSVKVWLAALVVMAILARL